MKRSSWSAENSNKTWPWDGPQQFLFLLRLRSQNREPGGEGALFGCTYWPYSSRADDSGNPFTDER